MHSKFFLLLLTALVAGSAHADVVTFEGTAAINNTGFDVGVMIGDRVEVEVDFEPGTGPTFPGGNQFGDSINSITLTFPDSGIELTGTGSIVNNTSLNNDVGGNSDAITWSAFGDITGTTLIGGETVTGLTASMTELDLTAAPDLLTTQLALPVPPFDLVSGGQVTLGMGMSLTGSNIMTVSSVSFVQTVPEPGVTLGAGAALLSLAWLRRQSA